MLQFLRFLAFLVLLVGLPAQAQTQAPGGNLLQSSGNFLANPSRFGSDAVVLAAADTQDRNLRPQASGAGKRVALVIGNGNYKSPDLTRLANPANDADDIARELQRFGFEVLAHKNLDRRQMKDAIAEFGRRSANAEASLFYFAGHGIQIKNQNYLIPVDAAARSEADIEDEGINVNYPLGEMESAQARLNLVLLDACRNNSFSGKFRSGASRGLAAPGSLPKGTVIVYATEPGNVASDGAGRNGLFTEGFLAGLMGEDLSLDGVLTRASEVVEHKSKGKQTPYINGPRLAQRNFHFIFKGPTTVVVQPQTDPETALWNEVKASGSRDYYDAYIKQYPKGKYLALALLELKKIDDVARAEAARQESERKAAEARAEREKQDAEKQAREMHPGKVFRDCPDCPELVVIPAGKFMMGSPASEAGRGDSENFQHQVNISRSFAVGKLEVTRSEFARFVQETGYSADNSCWLWTDKNPKASSGRSWRDPGYPQTDDHPVVCVSWDDANTYIDWLKRKTGQPYRLLSEAEWEYAARAGTTAARYWGQNPDDACRYANVTDQSAKAQLTILMTRIHSCTDGYVFTAPVGRFQPNAFGLYDMIGNAFEWVQDCWNENHTGAPGDASARTSGDCSKRVLRGGSWYGTPQAARVAARYWVTLTDRYDSGSVGFRLARTLSP